MGSSVLSVTGGVAKTIWTIIKNKKTRLSLRSNNNFILFVFRAQGQKGRVSYAKKGPLKSTSPIIFENFLGDYAAMPLVNSVSANLSIVTSNANFSFSNVDLFNCGGVIESHLYPNNYYIVFNLQNTNIWRITTGTGSDLYYVYDFKLVS